MKFKPFNYYLSLIKENTTLNSEKETKLEEYNNKVQLYNNNKNKFKSIFSQQQERWEDEAKKIINGNEYLFMHWRLVKLENNIENTNSKIRTGKLTNDDRKNLELDIQTNKKEFEQVKKEIQQKITQDLNEINQL